MTHQIMHFFIHVNWRNVVNREPELSMSYVSERDRREIRVSSLGHQSFHHVVIIDYFAETEGQQ